jgi:hypothetical protein
MQENSVTARYVGSPLMADSDPSDGAKFSYFGVRFGEKRTFSPNSVRLSIFSYLGRIRDLAVGTVQSRAPLPIKNAGLFRGAGFVLGRSELSFLNARTASREKVILLARVASALFLQRRRLFRRER